MKKIWVLALLAPSVFFGYELGMIAADVPSPLEKMTLEFYTDHRFYGSVTEDPFGTLFGLYAGANSLLGLKFAPVKGLEIGASRRSVQKEWVAGASYSHRFPAAFIRGRLGIRFFTYTDATQETRPMNLFYYLNLQSEPLLGRIKPTITVAYDGYNQRVGLGTGLSILLFRYVWYFEEISLLAEYYPVLGRPPGADYLGESDVWLAGLGFSTSGHQFILSIANTYEEGPRRLMLGSDSEGFHLALGIKRIFKF